MFEFFSRSGSQKSPVRDKEELEEAVDQDLPEQPGTASNLGRTQPKVHKRAFISYSTLDRSDAFILKHLLNESSITVWLDVFDIRVTGKIQSDLLDIIKQHDLFCLLLSPKSVQSPWVIEEISVAKKTAGVRLFPIILRPCVIPHELQGEIGFDAREGLMLEGVQLRLMRQITGHGDEELIVDLAQIELQHRKYLQETAQRDIVEVQQSITAASQSPIRHLSIDVSPLSFPADPDKIVELKLQFNTLFKGTMSFFLTTYQEGRTWPNKFHGLEEKSYKEYYLSTVPRLEGYMKWFDRVVPLQQVIKSGDVQQTATFLLDFDGVEFQPRVGLGMLQVFEIASLETLIRDRSHFELYIHNVSKDTIEHIRSDTDIDISISARVAEKTFLQLYESSLTREKRNLQEIPELCTTDMSPILRAALLEGCWKLSPKPNKKPVEFVQQAVDRAIKMRKFESDDERRQGAARLFEEHQAYWIRAQWRDAYKNLEASMQIICPLVLGNPAPLLIDARIAYVAISRMTHIWMRQKSYQQAETIVEGLVRLGRHLVQTTPHESDFDRMLADAQLAAASVKAHTNKDEVVACLRSFVDIHHELHLALSSAARREAYVDALRTSMQKVQEWEEIPDHDVALREWEAALREDVQDRGMEEMLLAPPPAASHVPIWLRPVELEMWPTIPLRSNILRFSLRVPESISTEASITGTSAQINAHYPGQRDTEWLNIGFMGFAKEDDEERGWVDVMMALTGLPVMLEYKPLPTLMPGSWIEFGRQKSLMSRLGLDDARAYMGVAVYAQQGRSPPLLGRMYVLLLRRRMLRWKITVSFMTACLPGMPEALLASNDHIRAGGVLGYLELDAT